MKQIAIEFVKRMRSAKLVTGFVVVAAVATVSASSVVAAAPSYYDVAKPTAQKACYSQYGIWQLIPG